jgi:hypothetical protein
MNKHTEDSQDKGSELQGIDGVKQSNQFSEGFSQKQLQNIKQILSGEGRQQPYTDE